jgi:uncharacterized protein YndB with AHSA1/START domain
MAEKLMVRMLVNKDIETVWNAWTSPEHITKWNFASEDWNCPSAKNEFQNGGKFSYRMEAKDGSMGFDFDGVYDEITAMSKISFTLNDGRRVIVNFVECEESIEVTESFEPDDSVSLEMQQSGWKSILKNFKKHVEML